MKWGREQGASKNTKMRRERFGREIFSGVIVSHRSRRFAQNSSVRLCAIRGKLDCEHYSDFGDDGPMALFSYRLFFECVH